MILKNGLRKFDARLYNTNPNTNDLLYAKHSSTTKRPQKQTGNRHRQHTTRLDWHRLDYMSYLGAV
jgi:hypothetical protein